MHKCVRNVKMYCISPSKKNLLKLLNNFFSYLCITAFVNDIRFFRNDLNSLTYENIQRLPNSPTQNGTDSILKFYAELPSGRTIPKSILATIFVEKQNEIFSLDSRLESFTESLTPDERTLTPQQQENAVSISLIHFPVRKVSVTV